MTRTILRMAPLFLILACMLPGCKKEKTTTSEVSEKTFPKGVPQELNYETISALIQDMNRFSEALRPLDTKKAKAIAERYKGVFFEMKQKPLFLNVYPDPQYKRAVFLIVPKDPATGSTYLFKFDKNLPVVNSNTIEIQIRLQDPQAPLTCLMPMQDSEKYIQDVQSHQFTVRYKLYKKFLQSGTFDFDALTIPTYRSRGVPFIVFDLDEAELTDTTAKFSCKCKQI